MKVIYGNILEINQVDDLPVVGRCFTSNGEVTSRGNAVMGAGVAKVFRDNFPGIDKILGNLLQADNLNIVRRLGLYKTHKTNLSEIICFPTKYDWRKPSSIHLIKKSAIGLKELIEGSPDLERGIILLPKPGCDNGKLDWDEVKEVIEDILPDNVYIISLEKPKV